MHKKQNRLEEIIRHCDALLKTKETEDYGGAANGLQVENRGGVTKIAAAVDASAATARLSVEQGADLLLVHHGLFWGPSHPWTGARYRLLKLLLDHNLAVYSSHLPLDAHPTLGNNAQLCSLLGLRKRERFFLSHGQHIGFKATAQLSREALVAKVERATKSQVRLVPAGPAKCKRIGVVSGGAGGDLKIAADEGVDTFITGEGPHWSYAMAEELGINILYAGHYATEVFGVKALAAHLSRRFGVPWVFIDHPTGL
jgi:dinuclear metal center YbgI/SA1388 family protein